MSDSVRNATRELHEFLYRRVYHYSSSQSDAENARRIVRALYRYFNDRRDLLPPEYRDPEHQVVDYIAGMTDHYALRTARELGLP